MKRTVFGCEMLAGTRQAGGEGTIAHVIPAACLLVFLAIALRLLTATPFPGALDELEHISYAAYLQEAGRLLPKFEVQRRLFPDDLGSWDIRPNYIGHPSPFYVFVGLFLDRALPPDQAVLAPRLASAGMVLVGVALALHRGRRHFGRDPLALAVFCGLLALCPKLLAVAGQVSNDSLAFLGGALAYWGTGDKERRRLGSAAIVLGLTFALWAKLSAGLAVGAWLGIMFLTAAPYRYRLLAPLGCGIAVGVVPYLFMIWNYGALVPVAAENFGNIDQMNNFAGYLPTFLLTMGFMWSISPTHVWSASQAGDIATITLFWAMICCVALGGWLAWRRGRGTCAVIAAVAPVAFALILPIHLWFASTSLGHSLPAASFRYYLPLWPPLAHAAAFSIAAAPARWHRVVLAGIAFASLAAGWAFS
jgi:hypothetical protein